MVKQSKNRLKNKDFSMYVISKTKYAGFVQK
jgi:hypothetical protein